MGEKEKAERIKNIEAQYEKAIRHHSAIIEYQMKNYYDCVDDYSWGGVCTKAADEELNLAKFRRDKLIEQVENGFITIKERIFCLCDLNGNIVSQDVRNGMFGYFWVTNDETLVSVPKKMQTLNKKGYEAKTLTRTYYVQWDGRFTKNNSPIYKDIVLANEEMSASNLDEIYDNRLSNWVTYLYET